MVEAIPSGAIPEGVNPSRELAGFVASTDYDALPAAIVSRAKNSILDLIGVAVKGSESESATAFYNYIERQGGAPESSVVCSSLKTTAMHAATVNGTYAHATELSETFTRATVHPGNVILPAVLAMAERERSTGRDVIVATAVGYEVLVRLGLAAGISLLKDQGYHPPSVLGVFGAAGACASLAKLDEAGADSALGIASSYSPTALIAAFRGATIKEMFEGYVASIGVMSADLARDGITGLSDWHTDWFKAVTVRHSLRPLVEGLGKDWVIDSGGLHFKHRAAVALGQPVIDAAERLARKHRFDPASIRSVVVESGERVRIGGERSPKSVVAAKASVPWLAAFALVHPDALADDPHLIRSVVPEVLEDPRVTRVADLVELVVDPTIEHEFETAWPMKFAARVTVGLDDGSKHAEYVDIWPSTSNMTFDEVAAKFRDVCRGVLDPDRIERIVESVRTLEDVADAGELMRLTTSASAG